MVVLGIDDDRNRRDEPARLPSTPQRIEKENTTKSLTTVTVIDGQSAKHRCRDQRVSGKLPSDIFREFRRANAERAERVEAGKLYGRSLDEDENLCNVPGHILPSLLAQVAIKRLVTGGEGCAVVMFSEQLELICRIGHVTRR